jgi:hypothetical protein
MPRHMSVARPRATRPSLTKRGRGEALAARHGECHILGNSRLPQRYPQHSGMSAAQAGLIHPKRD